MSPSTWMILIRIVNGLSMNKMAKKMNAIEDEGRFEETIHHYLDTVAPSSSRLEKLSYIRSGKRKM